MRAAGALQREQRCINPFRGQPERAEVHPNALGRLEIQMRLHRLGWIHVNDPHEPSRLVGADGQKCEVDRAKTPPDVAEEGGICGVAREEDARALNRQQESTPQGTVSIQWTPRGKVLRRRQHDRHGGGLRLLPPIELLDSPNPCGFHNRPVSQRRDYERVEALREQSERVQIAVIVVIVTEQHRRDRRQVVEGDSQLPNSPRSNDVQWAGALGIHRVGQNIPRRRLNQKCGVTDERRDSRGPIQ